ncbi:DUF5708 family protein [Streptomyces iconiensis]|uniref:DUF5708 family protein n=1 Tax=Streptomyces iconiensis TaxID=1384038 RepID=A0ABT7A3H7_9ACTN|nr:DUF5708 family protein [Streptomyces iconiensis]MDJ1135193.1 DUF5708 family protein [Streptomyces iconiensis]
MNPVTKSFLEGAAHFIAGLGLWLFGGGVEIPVITLTALGVVLMAIGVLLVAKGGYLTVRARRDAARAREQAAEQV